MFLDERLPELDRQWKTDANLNPLGPGTFWIVEDGLIVFAYYIYCIDLRRYVCLIQNAMLPSYPDFFAHRVPIILRRL